MNSTVSMLHNQTKSDPRSKTLKFVSGLPFSPQAQNLARDDVDSKLQALSRATRSSDLAEELSDI